jgi:hypothetical protein
MDMAIEVETIITSAICLFVAYAHIPESNSVEASATPVGCAAKTGMR